MRGLTRGLLWFWIHCKHLFCTKNMNSAQNGPTKLGFSDESSLFTVLWGPFLGQRMFFEQNKCLQWIQNRNKPLVWPLTCYSEQVYFGVFSSCMVKSMGYTTVYPKNDTQLAVSNCYHTFYHSWKSDEQNDTTYVSLALMAPISGNQGPSPCSI